MKHMLKTILLILLFIQSVFLHGQKKYTTTKLKIESIPKEIKYTGKIIDAIIWEDGLGKNLVITNETKSQISASTRKKRRHSEIKSINKNETETGERIYIFDKWRKNIIKIKSKTH
jgi:hypothetical protein